MSTAPPGGGSTQRAQAQSPVVGAGGAGPGGSGGGRHPGALLDQDGDRAQCRGAERTGRRGKAPRRRSRSRSLARGELQRLRGPRDQSVACRGPKGRKGQRGQHRRLRRACDQGTRKRRKPDRSQATAKLRKAGFKPTTKTQASATVPSGRVIATEPSANTELQVGSPVKLIVSSGPEPVHVPDVTGQSLSAAEATLTNAGLKVGKVSKPRHRHPGSQHGALPDARHRHLGQGRQQGRSGDRPGSQGSRGAERRGAESDARRGRAGAGGLQAEGRPQPTTEASQVGLVLQQSPAAEEQAPKGSTVTITVGTQATTTTTTTPTTTTPAPAPPASIAAAVQATHPEGPLTVAVLAGGRSSEHEVSLSSAAAVRDGLLAGGHEVELDRDRPRRRLAARGGGDLSHSGRGHPGRSGRLSGAARTLR